MLLFPLLAGAQTLTAPSVSNFGNAFTDVRDSISIPIQNLENRVAHWTGWSASKRYGNLVFRPADSTGSIPALSTSLVKFYFEPEHNILYEIDLVMQFDSGFGQLVLPLQGQGVYVQSEWAATQNLSEEALKTALKTILSSATSLSYNSARDQMYGSLDNVGGVVECVYTGRTAAFNDRPGATANSFNTEHTIPQSLFGSSSPMQSDIHHLFPTDETANSIRSNNPFGTVANPSWQQGGSKYGASVFEPRDVHKGDAARAVFYFMLRYSGNANLTSAYSSFVSGQEAILRQWHAQDPPSAKEIARNNGIELLQGNRSPLVDEPNMIERIHSLSSTSLEPTVLSWDFATDSILLRPGASVEVFFINTGNQTLSLSALALSDPVNFEILQQASSVAPRRAGSILLRAKNTAPSGALCVLTAQATGLPTISMQLKNGGGGGASNPLLQALQPDGAAAIGASRAQVEWGFPQALSSSGASVLAVISKSPQPPVPQADWIYAAANRSVGAGDLLTDSTGVQGFAYFNGPCNTDLLDTLSNLFPSTDYTVYAWTYRHSNDSVEFSSVASQNFTTADSSLAGPSNCARSLFFSEYVEGSGNSKCVEIYNPHDSSVSLSGFRVYTNFNGTTNQSVLLSGTLAPGGVHVVCNPGSATALLSEADQTNTSAISFNGNDLVSLVRIAGGDTLDRIGDPDQLNTFWTVSNSGANVDLVDVTLVRADSVRLGEREWSKARLQWLVYASNFADSLGSHSVEACSEVPLTPVVWALEGHQLHGYSVALKGDWALVGSPALQGNFAEWADSLSSNPDLPEMGAVSVFHKVEDQWIEWWTLRAPDRDSGDRFGEQLALGSDFYAVGAPFEGSNSSGAVYIFEIDAQGDLIDLQKIKPILPNGARFGQALSASGNTLFVGAPGSGGVYVCAKNVQGHWTALPISSSISGLGTGFGHAVVARGDTLFASAPNTGKVGMFTAPSGTWIQSAIFIDPDLPVDSSFGSALAFLPPYLVASAPSTGRLYVWNANSSTGAAYAGFPEIRALAPVSGSNTFLAGAPSEQWGSGAVLQLSLSGSGAPVVEDSFSAFDAARGDRFGYSVSTDGSHFMAGAPANSRAIGRAFGIENGGFEIRTMMPGMPLISPMGVSTAALVSDLPFEDRSWIPAWGRFSSTADLSAAEAVRGGSGDLKDDLKIYPNPTSNTLNISLADAVQNSELEWNLFDALGRKQASGTSNSVDLSALEVGVYILRIHTPGRSFSVRVLRNP